VTVYTTPDVTGPTFRALSVTAHPRLESAFSSHIESLTIACQQSSRSGVAGEFPVVLQTA
jgi:hypothetical protein